MMPARIILAIGLAISLARAEDVRCENNRRQIAQLRQEYDRIEQRLTQKGLLNRTVEQLREKMQGLRTDLQTNIADLRRGIIRKEYQSPTDRRNDASYWGLPWNRDWDENFAAYFQAFLAYVNQVIQDTDRIQQIDQQIAFHERRLKELGCNQNPLPPKVEPLPGDAERPASPPASSVGALVLTKTDIKPAHEDVGGVGNVRSQFTNTTTSTEINYTETTSDGRLVQRIKTHFDYAITSSGSTYVLRPGDTLTVTITGTDRRAPMNTGGAWGVTGAVHQSGLQQVSGKPCWVGAGFNDGYHATCSGEFVFQVTPSHDEVSLSFAGNFGIGDAVTFTWAKSR